MSIILKTPSNGSVTLAEQDTASDVVVTVPAVTATLLNNSSGVMNIGSGQVVKDASGNLGLGVTPSAWGGSIKSIQIGGRTALYSNASNNTFLGNNYYDDGTNYRYLASAHATDYYQTAGAHVWRTAPSGTAGNAISFTQAMSLEANGNLFVNTSVDPRIVGGKGAMLQSTSSYSALVLAKNYSGDIATVQFYHNGTMIGYINNSNTGTSYVTTSDYRLKENVTPMMGALAKVAALKPCTYTWKADGSAGQGFIAHELQAVVPDCVTGEKDAIDDEGKPQYQGIDVSFLVATLTAAIQEQQAALTQLQADVAALQGAA